MSGWYEGEMRTRTLVGSALVLCAMCVDAYADTGDDTVTAEIDSINEADLGRPVSSSFAPLTGKDGALLFPGSKVRKTIINSWESSFIEVRDTTILRANARAWGIVDGSLSASSDKRFLVFRVAEREYTLEVGDAVEPRQLDAGSSATYYVRKIHYGRIYQIVISGTKDTLDASIASKIQLLAPKFGVRDLEKQFKVNVAQKAKGLKPTRDALFATSPNEIKAAYQDKDMGPAVPILVEYRRIGGTKIDPPADIDWSANAGSSGPQTRVRVLTVQGNNSDWTTSSLTIAPDELVIGRAQGAVQYSSWNPRADADATGSGGLEMRIGTSVFPAGKAWIADHPGASGELKFRVRDTKYTDNSGAFTVTVIVVHQETLKTDCQIIDPQGTLAPCPP